MKCRFKTKNSLANLINPLKIISSIFATVGEPPKIIIDCKSDHLFITTKDKGGSVLVMYKMNTANVFESYQVTRDQLGFNDVPQFLSILEKYSKNVYDDDSQVLIENINNQLVISCEEDSDHYYLGSLNNINRGMSTFDSSSAEKAITFSLKDKDYRKLILNMSSYKTKSVNGPTLGITGEKGKKQLKFKLFISEEVDVSYSEFVLEVDTEITSNFNINFAKEKFQCICTNDKSVMTIYTVKGRAMIAEAKYTEKDYEMTIYLAPKKVK